MLKQKTQKQVTLSVIVLLYFFSTIQAQDPYFSQFYANRVYLNPAYAGFDPGTTLTVNYRDQWFGVPDGDASTFLDSYRTFNVTAGFQMPCFLNLEDINLGTAISVFSDAAGGAPMRTLGAAFAVSHEQPLVRTGIKSTSKLKRLDLRLGAQFGFMQKQLRGDYFIYSDFLDPVGGLITAPAALNLSSGLYPSLNAGVMLRGRISASKYKETLFTAGLSFSNVNQPVEELMDGAGGFTIPARITFHAGTTHKITSFKGIQAPTYIAPQFRWDTQADFRLNLQTIGAYVFSKAYYTGLFVQFPFGASEGDAATFSPVLNRNTVALILNAGIDMAALTDAGKPWRKRRSGITLGFTYDVNLSGLTSATTLGVIEVNLRANLNNERKRQPCAALGKFELYDGKCPVRF
jgi:type IX secretion system PorP/SprF family membrane protein